MFCHCSPYAVGADGVRNLIGRRTQSDWTADAIRSGGVRSTMTFAQFLPNKTTKKRGYDTYCRSLFSYLDIGVYQINTII